MMSLYQAYQAYERRVMRGEFALRVAAASRQPFLARLGDLLIRAGAGLKRRYGVPDPVTRSLLTGSRP